MIGGIEHEIDRRFEPLRHLGRVGVQLQIGRDYGNHRGDRIAAAAEVGVARPDHSHIAGVDAQLLVRLTQGGFDRVLAGIDLAAGEGDLAGVRTHVGGAVDQQEARPRPGSDCRQHGGGSQVGRGEVAFVAVFRLSRMALGVEALQPLNQCLHPGTSEKAAPWLVTVRSASASSTSCSQVLRLSRASVPWRTAR